MQSFVMKWLLARFRYMRMRWRVMTALRTKVMTRREDDLVELFQASIKTKVVQEITSEKMECAMLAPRFCSNLRNTYMIDRYMLLLL
jgi:hypothetical protein